MEDAFKQWCLKEGIQEDEVLVISVNGEEKKILKRWLEGKGRGSALSLMVLGSKEGLSGGRNLTIDQPKLAPLFDFVILWFMHGFDSVPFVSPIGGRSRDLYALAKYLGLDQLQADIERKGWDIGPTVLSCDNVGVISKFVRHKGFGFILDKKTREEVWFSLHAVQTTTTKKESTPNLAVGEECLYDMHVTRKGRRPNSAKAANIRALSGGPFCYKADIMI